MIAFSGRIRYDKGGAARFGAASYMDAEEKMEGRAE